MLDAFSAGGARIDEREAGVGNRGGRQRGLRVRVPPRDARGHPAAGRAVPPAPTRTTHWGPSRSQGLEVYRPARRPRSRDGLDSRGCTFGFYRAGRYVQDDVKAHKSLTVSAGVRHEATEPRGRTMEPVAARGGHVGADRHGKLVITGGVGLVFNWFESRRSSSRPCASTAGGRYNTVIRNPGSQTRSRGCRWCCRPAVSSRPRISACRESCTRRYRFEAGLAR